MPEDGDTAGEEVGTPPEMGLGNPNSADNLAAMNAAADAAIAEVRADLAALGPSPTSMGYLGVDGPTPIRGAFATGAVATGAAARGPVQWPGAVAFTTWALRRGEVPPSFAQEYPGNPPPPADMYPTSSPTGRLVPYQPENGQFARSLYTSMGVPARLMPRGLGEQSSEADEAVVGTGMLPPSVLQEVGDLSPQRRMERLMGEITDQLSNALLHTNLLQLHSREALASEMDSMEEALRWLVAMGDDLANAYSRADPAGDDAPESVPVEETPRRTRFSMIALPRKEDQAE